MPLFVFVSGFLYIATWRPTSYKHFVVKKFKRLMIPYLFVSIIIIGLKLLTPGAMTVENPVTCHAFLEIFYSPAAGFFLWFIWALWWMMLIIPLFHTPASRFWLFILSIPLHFYSHLLPETFCLKESANMLVFFCAGSITADYMNIKTTNRLNSGWQIISILFFILCASVLLTHQFPPGFRFSSILFLITNFSGIAMFLSLSNYWRLYAPKKILQQTFSIAYSSFLIYLLHTTFEGLAKAILYKYDWFMLHPLLVSAWIGATIVILCGTLIPYWLGTNIFSKFKLTSFLFGIQHNAR